MSLIEDINSLRRPRVLVRAARFSMLEYRRDKVLKRVLKRDTVPGPMAALALLLHRESELETMRQEGDAGYSVAKHIDVLSGLMGEISCMGPTLRKSAPNPQTGALKLHSRLGVGTM